MNECFLVALSRAITLLMLPPKSLKLFAPSSLFQLSSCLSFHHLLPPSWSFENTLVADKHTRQHKAALRPFVEGKSNQTMLIRFASGLISRSIPLRQCMQRCVLISACNIFWERIQRHLILGMQELQGRVVGRNNDDACILLNGLEILSREWNTMEQDLQLSNRRSQVSLSLGCLCRCRMY